MNKVFELNCDVVEKPRAITEDVKGLWRKTDPTMVDGRVIVGGMFEHQRAWWALPNFTKVLVAGYGAGKTMIGSKRIIASALENHGCPVAAVSPTFGQARLTTIPTIKALCAGKKSIYGSGFWYRYNASNHEFSIRYRGREGTILILSGDNPDSLRGPNLAAGLIDEPFIQAKEVYTQLVARIRHPNAVKRELLLTGTPEELNWGYELCTSTSEKLDVGMVMASTRLNKALDSAYVDRLEGALTEKAVAAYVEGQFVNLSDGLVYYAFDPTPGKLHVRELPLPEYPQYGAGMDFNVNPMSAAVFWRAGSHIHYIEEVELPNADTEFMCSYLREKYPKLVDVYPDASGNARKTSSPGGRTDFHYIRDAGFQINAKYENPKRRDRYNACNGKLRPKNQPPTISISPKCKNLIRYLSQYNYDKMSKQESMSHLLDAWSYPIAYLFPVTPAVAQRQLAGL